MCHPLRRAARFVGALFPLAVVACADDTTSAPPIASTESEGWTVIAQTPTLSDDGTTLACGMEFVRESGAETRGGGVCAVADLGGATPCTTAADCAGLPLPEGGFHYCAAALGMAEARCWTRPGGPEYCTRAPDRTPGVYPTPAVPKLVDGAATLWACYACMADAATPGGCGSGDPEQFVTAVSATLEVTP